MPKSSVTTGTVIQNTATVVFDVNPPINTPTWSNTVDNTKPTGHVNSLAATQAATNFTVSWAGSDVGAGVQDYTVYSSDNGGPFTAWQTNTTATSAMFTGIAGHTYGFYSIARDLVGNVENSKSVAEATTTINAPTPLTVTTVSLAGGVVGTVFSQTLATVGGTTPYVWSISGGRLPIGLTLNSATGQITGTPTNPVASFVTFTVTDSSLPMQTASMNLTFTILSNTLTITTTSLPNGQVGVAYSQAVATTGGTQPFKWELTGGSALPAGLTLNASIGVISGTPTAPVTNYRLLLRVTDSSTPTPQTASTSFTLTIVP